MRNTKFSVSSIFLLLFSVFLATPTEAQAVIMTINNANGQNQTIQGDSNVTFSTNTGTNVHSLGWNGYLPISRGGTGVGSFTAGSLLFFNGSTFAENNSKLFWDNTSHRLGIGTSTPTATLDVFGNAKMSSLISTGDATINTLTVGLGGGSSSANTAVGYLALASASSISGGNTAIGYQAMVGAGDAENSTAVGSFALTGNATSNNNTAVGGSAMKENFTGSFNAAVGSDALRLNEIVGFNSALGHQALRNNINGSNNTAVGYQAGLYQATAFNELSSADNSIYIGANTRGYDNNDNNSIVIGQNAIGAGANTAVIGNSNLGQVYFGSSSGQASIHARKLFLGSSSVPGCIIMGDTTGGVSYITLDNGALTISSTPPSACQ